MSRWFLAANLVFIAMLGVGCGGGPARVVVSGEVTYEGKPLELGEIRFIPVEGNEAPISGGQIRDGRYTVEKGVPTGEHRVRITGLRLDPNYAHLANQYGPGELPQQQYLPSKFNDATELTADIPYQWADVELNFNLQK